MEDNKKAPANVLQFPTRKKEAESTSATTSSGDTVTATNPASPKAVKKKRATKKSVGASVLAVTLATFAANSSVFGTKAMSVELASNSSPVTTGVARTIASVDSGASFKRDAAWEKDLAESLASPKIRDIASTGVGRAATLEEKLRWGTLEEKYTISFRPDIHEIETILFQDPMGAPSYVLDRAKFLKEYGELFNATSTKLKSVEESSGKTFESYFLLDKEMHTTGEARFELDRHERLISLKVEPSKI